MAILNGANYDHVDLQAVTGGDTTRHMIQDTAGRAMLAPTEASSTASMAHVPGTDSEFFVYNNKLCQATVSIAQGGTITLNTNCKEAPLGKSVSELKSAINDAPTEVTAQDLLALEQRKTEVLGIVLDEMDTLIQNLPSDEMALEIRDKLVDTNGWLDMIYNEMVLREAV